MRKGNDANRKGPAITTAKGRGLTSVVESWMPIFPSATVKKLRYSTNFALSNSSGAVATYVFRANDLFDPDVTSAGHQPMGFDQMMLSYDHFVVLKARIICTFVATSGSTPTTCCIRQDANASAITVIDRIIEFGGLVQAEIGTSSGGDGNNTLELSVDIARLQGVSRSALSAMTSLRGDVATSPTELSYFHVQSWNAAAATTAVNVNVVLEQLALFIEPRDLSQSLSRTDDGKHAKPRSCPHSTTSQCSCETRAQSRSSST